MNTNLNLQAFETPVAGGRFMRGNTNCCPNCGYQALHSETFREWELFDSELDELALDTDAGKEAFTAEVVRIAKRERDLWQNGRKKETYTSMKPILRKYWTEGLGMSTSSADSHISKRTAWSAAFISYVMKTAGAGSHFKYSAAHWKYIKDAKSNAVNQSSNPFWLFRVDHQAGPYEGELICNTRSNSSMSFDNAHTIDGYQATHCDIVTEVRTDRIIVIGGNKGDSVKEQTLWLDAQGRFDMSRNSLSSGKYIGIISIW